MTASNAPDGDKRAQRRPTSAAVVRAALTYLAPVFALGWILGPLRVLAVAPRCGELRASAAEAAVMAGAIYSSAGATVTRLGPERSVRSAFRVGALALLVVLALEIGGARVVRRLSLRAYLATYVSPSGAISAATFGWFALAPLVAAYSSRTVLTRASSKEKASPCAGDEMIADAIGSMTHAITIDAPRSSVWPWLVQMGAGRAGWYSYDALDNGGRASAKRLIPEFQSIAVGDTLPWTPSTSKGFRVLRADAERCLVLAWIGHRGKTLATWAFTLEDANRPAASRLRVRFRASRGSSFFGVVFVLGKAFVSATHGLMQRKQLLNIADRASKLRGIDERAPSGANVL